MGKHKRRTKNRAKRAERERVHNLGANMVKEFMTQSSTKVASAIVSGKALLSQYMKNPILKEECLWDIKIAEETLESLNLTTMMKECRLADRFTNPKMIKIKVPDTHQVNGEGDGLMKLTISSTEYGKVLNMRCPKNQSRSSKVTIIEDEQGDLMAIIFRDIIPAELMEHHKLAEEWFGKEDKTMYTHGCRAATHPNIHRIAHQMKDWKAMNSAGLMPSNVKRVLNLKVTRPGTNTNVSYKNPDGRTIKRTFTSAINRKAYKLSKMKEEPFGDLITFMNELYKNVSTFWIRKFGCPEDKIDKEVEIAMMAMQVGCCSIKQHEHQLGIHSDPSSKFPHCVFGKTTCIWDNDTSKWIGRSCNGGQLVLVDGCIPLDYGPSDVIFLNGNFLHGITNLKPKEGHKQIKGETLSRFSMQLYTDYQRNENKHGDYGSFSSRWS